MYFAHDNQGRAIEAMPGLIGYCPECKEVVIPRCGVKNQHHWAHNKDASGECTHGNDMSKWHYEWQKLAEINGCNLEVRIGNHIADAVKDKTVFEFQRSNILHNVLKERSDDFYEHGYSVVWILGIESKEHTKNRVRVGAQWRCLFAEHKTYQENMPCNACRYYRWPNNKFTKYGDVYLCGTQEQDLLSKASDFFLDIYGNQAKLMPIVHRSDIFYIDRNRLPVPESKTNCNDICQLRVDQENEMKREERRIKDKRDKEKRELEERAKLWGEVEKEKDIELEKTEAILETKKDSVFVIKKRPEQERLSLPLNSMISFFNPSSKVTSLRSNQVEALNSVESILRNEGRLIEIEAPPGSGKSVIASTIMNFFTSNGYHCLVTSPQNMQVDQYASGGFGMFTLKGREHYPCYAGKENCSKGYCQLKVCPDGRRVRKCKDHEYSECRRCVCNGCYYKQVFKAFRDSSKGNTNFMLLMLDITNKPDVLIIDEADTIEDSIRSFNSIVVPELFEHFRFPEIIPDLHGFIDRMAHEVQALRKPKNTETELKKIQYLEGLCFRILNMIEDYATYKEPWCVTTKAVLSKTKFEPVTIERFLKELIENRIVIMMSATPPHYPGFEKVRVESIFPVESRQWIYDPFPGSLVKKQREASIPRAAVWLTTLKGKTLVHCYDSQTRVLTLDGMKHFQELTPMDLIATLNKKGNVEYQKPINIINYQYCGEMISMKNSRLDLLVTPDHRMYVSSLRGDKDFGYVFKTARELKNGTNISGYKKTKSFKMLKTANWSGKEIDKWIIPHIKYKPNHTIKEYHTKESHSIPIKIWMRFLGWYISEGYVTYDTERSQYQVNISQKNIDSTDIPSIVKEMGYIGYIRRTDKSAMGGQQIDNMVITDKSLAGYLLSKFGKDCYSKHLTKDILELSADLLNEFVDTYCRGDGVKRKHYKQMYTSSKKLKDNLIEIGLKTGHQVNVGYLSEQDRKKWCTTYRNGHDIWVIGYSYMNKHARIKCDEITTEHYDGYVGCVEVPNSIIFVERNGKSVWCGNCKSYETANKVHLVMRSIGRSSLLQINNDDNTDTVRYSRYDAVSAFLKSQNPDEVLFSVNQGRGLDLWQPEIINNVILVVPWQNPTDPLTKMKCQIIGEAWKNKKTADDITQAIARHFRNEKMGIYKGVEVPKRAYIIDASFGNWYLRNRELFPKNFVESQKI